MANIKDCPGFETFGADVKEARKVKQLSRKTLAEQVNIDWRYLANIENADRRWRYGSERPQKQSISVLGRCQLQNPSASAAGRVRTKVCPGCSPWQCSA